MHDSVRAIWVRFNEPLEGIVPRLYADVLGLVTTGMGNLVDPMPLALSLPWELPAGIPATKDQVAAAWKAVKDDPKCAKLGWKYAVAIPENNVRLPMPEVEKLIMRKLDEHDRSMQVRFSDWDDRPADAQLAAHSMAWAMGSGFWRKFPRFTVSFTNRDYRGAGIECAIAPAHGTIVERNLRNRRLLFNASNAAGRDPSVLVWKLPASS